MRLTELFDLNVSRLSMTFGENTIKYLLMILCTAAFLMTGCPAEEEQGIDISAKSSSLSIIQKCEDFARIPVREYLLDNNVWGKENISNYRQCIWADTASDPLTAGWSWSWGESGDRKKVKAYPEIHYGWDWDKKFTTPKLPLKINKINKLQVTYDVTTSAEGLYNLAFDLWLTKAPFPTRENLSREVMIWVDGTQHSPGTKPIKKVSIDGNEYELFINHDWNKWTYFAFIKVVPQPRGTLNVHAFLSFLEDEGYLSPNESLVEVEIGNEVWAGKGQTVVKNFSVNL